MSHIYTHYYSLEVVPYEYILHWHFHTLFLFLTSALHPSSLLHLAAEIILGYVWKHSCASLIPPLGPRV